MESLKTLIESENWAVFDYKTAIGLVDTLEEEYGRIAETWPASMVARRQAEIMEKIMEARADAWEKKKAAKEAKQAILDYFD